MIKRRFRVGIMEINLYLFPLLLFILSIIGIALNQSNIILILIFIEIMLLSISLNFIIHAYIIDNLLGQICSIYIITVAAVESAIGLSIMITFYKLRGSISIRILNLLKG